MIQKRKINLETLSIDQVDTLIRDGLDLLFTITITTPFSVKVINTTLSLQQLYQYLNQLIEKKFVLLTISSQDLSLMEQSANNRINDHKIPINIINQIFREILFRKDIIGLKLTLELLGLQQNDYEFDSSIPIAQSIMGLSVSHDLQITGTYVDPNNDFIAFSLAKFGKIWSLIEPELLGQFKLFRRVQGKADNQINYEQIFSSNFHYRANCIEYVPITEEFMIGTCEGKIVTFKKMKMFESFTLNQFRLAQIISHPIYQMKLFEENELYVIGEKNLKIVEPSNFQIIGGGSLKSRLDEAILYSLSYSREQKLLLLGDSRGRVFIYKRTKQNIEYISFIEQSIEQPIMSQSIENDLIFIVCSSLVQVLQFKVTEKGFVHKELSQYSLDQKLYKIQSNIEDFIYLKKQKVSIGILQNGQLIQWHSQTGKINQALQISKNDLKLMKYNQKEQTLIIISQDGYAHLIDFKQS